MIINSFLSIYFCVWGTLEDIHANMHCGSVLGRVRGLLFSVFEDDVEAHTVTVTGFRRWAITEVDIN